MQMQMPFFPEKTKLINSNIGLYQQDGFVYYLHNGSPIFCHAREDLNSYRYIIANLVVNHMCKTSEVSKALGIHIKNVQRYAKALRDNGTDWFFNREDHRGQCHKFTPDKKEQAQELLDKGYSAYRVAKELGLSEGAIRYHMRSGEIKKKK
jgi:transposase